MHNVNSSSVLTDTSVVFHREILSAPVRRIDEILAMPYSAEDFQGINLPPSDDDSWLRNGEDELNAELRERQKEIEEYEALKKHTKGQKQNVSSSSSSQPSEFNLGEITESMQDFVRKMSSFEGAEVPSNRFSSRLICDLYSMLGYFSYYACLSEVLSCTFGCNS
jgi:hypothetical protein